MRSVAERSAPVLTSTETRGTSCAIKRSSKGFIAEGHYRDAFYPSLQQAVDEAWQELRTTEVSVAARVSPNRSAELAGEGLCGRATSTAGEAAPSIVNDAMARKFWPGQNALGKEFVAEQNRRYQVIGIAANVDTARLGQTDGPLFYGLVGDGAAIVDAKLFLRTDGSTAAAVSAIPALVHQIDPNEVVDTESYQQIVEKQLLPAQRGAALVSALGLLALVLAPVGLTGVVSLATTQRIREIGVRIAFGAKPRHIAVLLLGHGVKLVSVGILQASGLLPVWRLS